MLSSEAQSLFLRSCLSKRPVRDTAWGAVLPVEGWGGHSRHRHPLHQRALFIQPIPIGSLAEPEKQSKRRAPRSQNFKRVTNGSENACVATHSPFPGSEVGLAASRAQLAARHEGHISTFVVEESGAHGLGSEAAVAPLGTADPRQVNS